MNLQLLCLIVMETFSVTYPFFLGRDEKAAGMGQGGPAEATTADHAALSSAGKFICD